MLSVILTLFLTKSALGALDTRAEHRGGEREAQMREEQTAGTITEEKEKNEKERLLNEEQGK